MDINAGFNVGSAVPIDSRTLLTYAQMRSVNENIMPDTYYCVCSEDKAIYVFDKTNTIDQTTGKFRKQVSGQGGVSLDVLEETPNNYIANFTGLS